MSYRFSNGRTTTVSSNHKIVQPYDTNLSRLNMEVERKDNDLTRIIYGINPQAFLKLVEDDQLDDLVNITIAGRSVWDGVGLWDSLYNYTFTKGMSACFFLTDKDFKPVPQSRIAYTSSFLNFNMPISRVHFNKVNSGDRIGIAIHDMNKRQTYVFLYVIDDMCVLMSPIKDIENRASPVPSVNATLQHALLIGYDCVATIVDIDPDNPYDGSEASTFVEWLNDSVFDVREAYPWKPHFIPVVPRELDRPLIETRLKRDLEKIEPITYSEFETKCREVYRRASVESKKFQQSKNTKNLRKRPSARDRSVPNLPIVEVVSLNDNHWVARFDVHVDPTETSWTFPKEDIGKSALTETFFTNQDLVGIDVDEYSKAMVLSTENFGENSYVRYFTINF